MLLKNKNFFIKLFIYFVVICITILTLFVYRANSNHIQKTNINTLDLTDLNPEQLSQRYEPVGKPNVLSKASLLLDSNNKYIIFADNPYEKVPIASTTKLMTALIVLENYNLDDILTVTAKAAKINGSKMNLCENEEISVLNLLKGLLIVSGNDAAYTFADNFHGKEGNGYDFFVKAMNNKAKQLNLKNTNFLNPAGLDDNAYSTAFDLAIIASEFIKYSDLTKITNTDQEIIYDISGKIKHTLKNSNRLVDPNENLYIADSFGLKTGFTELAGHCLVSAIDYKGRKIISVVLNTNEYTPPASAKESYKLLNWGKLQIDYL